MVWFRKREYTVLQVPLMKNRIPDGLWYKCDNCLNILYIKDFEQNFKVCPRCNFHTRLTTDEQIKIFLDENTFEEEHADIFPADPLGFVDSKKYPDRLESSQQGSGLADAIKTGVARIGGFKIVVGLMDFSFIGGSMGSVVGEKVTRSFERALRERLPVVMFCTSGGARMQEGILSLMQMAKTSIAAATLSQAGIPYISVLMNPTTAGVMASYASLGDVIIAEPDALVGFAGPRVIAQTINQILPKGFQKSEFVLEHGFIDVVAHRRDVKRIIASVLLCLCRDQQPQVSAAEQRETKTLGVT
jgi:acetyl-CoA carboxylase carboxyl transferase subunit beta